jgi:hypothetical protein
LSRHTFSFVAQGDHRVDAHGAASGDEKGEERDSAEQDRYARKRARISAGHAQQQAPQALPLENDGVTPVSLTSNNIGIEVEKNRLSILIVRLFSYGEIELPPVGNWQKW